MNRSILLGAALLAVISVGCKPKYVQPELGARKVEIIQDGKYQFKDLNKNVTLDAYEDWRLPMDQRIADLVSQMTLDDAFVHVVSVISCLSITSASARHTCRRSPGSRASWDRPRARRDAGGK